VAILRNGDGLGAGALDRVVAACLAMADGKAAQMEDSTALGRLVSRWLAQISGEHRTQVGIDIQLTGAHVAHSTLRCRLATSIQLIRSR